MYITIVHTYLYILDLLYDICAFIYNLAELITWFWKTGLSFSGEQPIGLFRFKLNNNKKEGKWTCRRLTILAVLETCGFCREWLVFEFDFNNDWYYASLVARRYFNFEFSDDEQQRLAPKLLVRVRNALPTPTAQCEFLRLDHPVTLCYFGPFS